MSVMLYVVLSVAYYTQLEAVDKELIAAINGELSSLAQLHGYGEVLRRGGERIYELGPENGLDPRRALEFLYRLQDLLLARREELFGFRILAECAEGSGPETVARSARQRLQAAEEENRIWLAPECAALFSDLVRTRRTAALLELVRAERSSPPGREARQDLWKRTRLSRRIVRKINTQVKARRTNRGIFIHGPVSAERKLLLDAVQQQLFHGFAVPRAPRLSPLFKRRSAFHPFLNSIDPFFLRAVGQYLNRWETEAWEDLQQVLWSMKPSGRSADGEFYLWPKGVPASLRVSAGKVSDQSPGQAPSVCPDHLRRDFQLAYYLYLLAYFRMMEENFLPAVLFCEDVDTYHPKSLEMLAELLADFRRLPAFVSVFSSARAEPPAALADSELESVPMRPLTVKDTARLAGRLYRGCELPQEVALELRRYARGKLVPLYHCLLFLEGRGFLAKAKGGYRWQEPEPLEKALPARSVSLSWEVIAGLPVSLKRLLYIVYLQSGLLDLWGLLDFLQEGGMARRDAFSLLRELENRGLVQVGNHAIALFPSFRRRLRRTVLEADPQLEAGFIDHLLGRRRRGEYPHLVLLFFLLSKAGRTVEALEVLSPLLKQKLDELDLHGVRAFLSSRPLRLGAETDASIQRAVQRQLAAANLRCALLQGRIKEAERLYMQALQGGEDFEVSPVKGDLFLQVSRYLLARGDTAMALQWVKKAVIQFQGAGHGEGERAATIGLGSILLADGKLDEALEYLGMADTTPRTRPGLEDVLSHGLRAVALFIQGNLSRAEAQAETGLVSSRALKRREWELFLQFLSGRISFELGFYDQALLGFQRALAVEALYENPQARRVLYCWLGRGFAYRGKLPTAVRVLEAVEDCWEKQFFLSECHFLNREYGRALEACERALSLDQGSTVEEFPGERIRWLDGIRDVEGRCFALLRDNALRRRLLQSFQGYLWGLTGNSERGVEQLHSITRGGGIPPFDPYQSLYNYFYACTLPEVRDGELDDSLTVLNRSLKLLQQRASRVEDSTERWRYLNNNYWNALIFAEARRKKMI